jgi:uncharacterized membrane protein YkvA (DUF1232 family)
MVESAERSGRASLARRIVELRAETLALYLAARHPRTPWYAKLVVAAIVAYALSPIDLIPDFVPILGYVDDLLLIPLGIAFAIKLIPAPVLVECRARARERFADGTPRSRRAAAVIVAIWLLVGVLGAIWAYDAFVATSAR